MSVQLPQPYGLEFAAWGSLAAEQLAEYGVQAPTPELPWQEWAAAALQAPALVSIPDPYGFTDWREWACRALETPL